MFNIEEGQESTGSSIQYIKPGINVVTLKTIEKATRGGFQVVDFIFENKEGGTIKHTLFPFDENAQWIANRVGTPIKYNAIIKDKNGKEITLKKGDSFTLEQSKAEALSGYLNEIKHIRNRFDSSIAIKGATFAELVNNLIKALEPFFGKKEIKLAAEKNGKYTNVKKYVPFLADLDDNKTLEALKLKLESEEPTPDQESEIPSSTSTSDEGWPTVD